MEDWWTSFFTGNWLDVQRQVYSEETSRAEAELITAHLALEPGMKALDVPVGFGRIALELAAAGVAVTGVDQSSTILEEAGRRATERGLALELRLGDMRDLPWQAAFDAAFCWWGSFGYLDDEGDAEFVRAVARTLKPGGRFLIETHVVESLYPKFQARDWSEVAGNLILSERTIDVERSRIDATWRIFNGDEWDTRRSSIRVYTYREMVELLRQAGFTDVHGFNGHTMEPFTFGASRIVMVGRLPSGA